MDGPAYYPYTTSAGYLERQKYLNHVEEKIF